MNFNDLSPIRLYTEIFAIKLTLKNTSEVLKRFIIPHISQPGIKPQIEASLLLIIGYTFDQIDNSDKKLLKGIFEIFGKAS
jgi:hypothetical protein